MRHLLLLALLLAALLPACGRDDAMVEPPSAGGAGARAPAGALTVSQALASDSDEPLLVQGELIAREGEPVRLCEVALESFPPQCGEPSLVVEGANLDELDLDSAEGVRFGHVELLGRVSDGALTVEETSL